MCEIWKEREMDDYSPKGGQKARWIRLSQLSELAKNLCNLHLKFHVLGEHLSSLGSLFHRIATRLSSAFLPHLDDRHGRRTANVDQPRV